MAEQPSTRIVVGVDGSPGSKRALRWAAQEATWRHARLDAVCAWSVPYQTYEEGGYIDPVPHEEVARATVQEAVESLTSPDTARPDIRAVAAHGEPAPALLEAAAGAELLVVGSRGHGGFVGLLVGSVSQRCVDHATGPVAVIPHAWAGDTSGRLVVGVDGSDASQRALQWAVDEARWRDARLDVVHAYEFSKVVAAFGASPEADRNGLEQATQGLLEDMVGAATGDAPRPRHLELIAAPGAPVPALLEAARGADLLVVGSRGRGTFHGLTLGSVSQQCLHHAPGPVVVIR